MEGAEYKLMTLVRYKPLHSYALLFAVIESTWRTWVYRQDIDKYNVVNAIQRLERSPILWKHLFEATASRHNSIAPADTRYKDDLFQHEIDLRLSRRRNHLSIKVEP